MTQEQVQTYLKRACQGDIEARNRIIEDYLPYVMTIARKLAFVYHVDFLDLVQEGNLALVKRFDKAVERADTITSYVGGIARHAMLDYCHMKSALIEKKTHEDYQAPFHEVMSLDVPLKNDEDGIETFADLLVEPPQQATREQDYRFLHREVEKLPDVQKTTVVCYYGLYDHPCELLEAIDQRRGVNKGSAKYAKRNALIRLKKALETASVCA